ncbi:tetratricopeptide repeat protein [Oceanibium sediminis]|uniref:tetratricopeptide repeat protein n=1 Tax=Oceanibium sediminis TaxID=2026339 RepID=UPI001300264A|nr:tetratricopeptide repeat protein [Oceanibium sediminis]
MKSVPHSSDPARFGRHAALLVSAAFLLAACAQDRLAPVGDGPDALRGNFVDGLDGLTLGHRLMAAGEYELALDSYYRAGAEKGLTVDVLSAIGSAQLRLGRLGQAERTLRTAIDKNDRFVPAWNALGIVLYSQGKTGEAREAFRVAFALDSGQSPEIAANLNAVDAKLQSVTQETPEQTDFRLVRRGNGRYLLLGN